MAYIAFLLFTYPLKLKFYMLLQQKDFKQQSTQPNTYTDYVQDDSDYYREQNVS